MTQRVSLQGSSWDNSPLRDLLKEYIAAFRRAQQRGHEAQMKEAAEKIDRLQRECKHPPYKIDIRPARKEHPRGAFQVGTPLHICFECNRLLAAMSAPYRYDHDTDESFEQVIHALKAHDQWLDHPNPIIERPKEDDQVEEILRSLLMTEEEPKPGRRGAGVGLDAGFLGSVDKPVADALMYLAGHVDAQASRIEELEEDIERIRSRLPRWPRKRN